MDATWQIFWPSTPPDTTNTQRCPGESIGNVGTMAYLTCMHTCPVCFALSCISAGHYTAHSHEPPFWILYNVLVYIMQETLLGTVTVMVSGLNLIIGTDMSLCGVHQHTQ